MYNQIISDAYHLRLFELTASLVMTEVVIIFMAQTHATRPADTHGFIMQARANNPLPTKLGHHNR